jgi:hypothetical protein
MYINIIWPIEKNYFSSLLISQFSYHVGKWNSGKWIEIYWHKVFLLYILNNEGKKNL